MKIHQLPHGARFEYQGEEYVKTGPLFATGPGGQRLIPKYAVLKPLGEFENAKEGPKNDLLSRAKVLDAFATFYAECKHRTPDDQQRMLAVAREHFLQALDDDLP
ncbi:MAG: hypothetical protein Q7U75_14760 [Desulfobacterales bacterium]|nr:hypothetical protein [Desulfobacterales bacterium]